MLIKAGLIGAAALCLTAVIGARVSGEEAPGAMKLELDGPAPEARGRRSSSAAGTISVHEWGLATIAWSGEDLPHDFPAFVRTPSDVPAEAAQPAAPEQPKQAQGVSRRKPIVYFHASSETVIDFDVSFTGGGPTHFYPTASRVTGNRVEFDNLRIVPVSGKDAGPNPPKPLARAGEVLAKDHWWNQCAAAGGNTRVALGAEADSFLFYEGKAPYLPALTISEGASNVCTMRAYSNWGSEPLVDFCALCAHNGKLFAKWFDNVPACSGSTPGTVILELRDPVSAEDVATELARRIVKTGLTEAEAKSFVDVWRNDLTGAKAPVCFYRFSDSELARMMPVTVSAQPGWAVDIKRAEFLAVYDANKEWLTVSPAMAAEDLFLKGGVAYGALKAKQAELLGGADKDAAKAEIDEIQGYLDRLLERSGTVVR